VRTESSFRYNPDPRKYSKIMNVFRVYTERHGCMEHKSPGGQSWVKVNTADTPKYDVTSVLHNELK
jgi:hypothetical protein